MNSRLRALRVLHPFPSFVNAGLVVALAAVAGAPFGVAALLSGAMLALQFCIGIVNDVADVRLDAQTKPWKPIPSGVVSVGSAQAAAAVLGVVALAVAATQGPIVAALAAVMLACGLVYDLWLKPTVFAWVCFSIAFAILPVYAWYGAVGEVPPLSGFLIPLAALAGPALQLSNGIVDLERDQAGGIQTLATRLGRRRALAAAVALLVVIYSLAWATLTLTAGSVSLAIAVATVLALAGVALQSRDKVALREAGWSLQVFGIALLGVGWLSAVA